MSSSIALTEEQQDECRIVANDESQDETAIPDVPEVAIRWILRNDTTSNVALATLSNVCRRWRQVTSRCIVEEEFSNDEDDTTTSTNKSRNERIPTHQSSNDEPSPEFLSLLLPSMIRELQSQQSIPSRGRPEINPQLAATTPTCDDTYCVAWFHPDGIEYVDLPQEVDDDSDDSDLGICRRTGRCAYSWRESSDDNVISCVVQWTGYTDAVDVLSPFGYSLPFVRGVLTEAATRTRRKKQHPSIIGETERDNDMHSQEKKSSLRSAYSSASSFSGMDDQSDSQPLLNHYKPHCSFAVRGATYARPEGYCLCWDDDALFSSFRSSSVAGENGATSLVKQQAWEGERKRLHTRRRELQRQNLPVVLWSEATRDSKSAKHDRESTTVPMGILQPCIQFLNINANNAIRMFTPPFDSPVATPVTVFCVAIATEDGCFFSGHNNVFELGHMYPPNDEDAITERSPVMLCADYKGPFTNLFERVSESNEEKNTSNELESPNYLNSRINNNFNSDDSSCDSQSAGGKSSEWKCQCPLSGLGAREGDGQQTLSESSDDKEVEKGLLCRGRLGPGCWHCYTAVFDGPNSRIRIDGIEEPIRCGSPIPPNFQAFLDGLTIAADNTFDMSLCFGEGSDGEGQGAMAELAVFKGIFEQDDMETVESHLMRKHGIEYPQGSSEQFHVDDEMTRLALYSLSQGIANNETTDSDTIRIPLRYLARLRQVSWKPINAVTGTPVTVNRIGTIQTGAESSDL